MLSSAFGMDVHQATIVVAVLNAVGKLIIEKIVATEAGAIVEFLQALSGPLHVTFEETTQAAWLYEVIRAHAGEVVGMRSTAEQAIGGRFEGRQAGCAEAG